MPDWIKDARYVCAAVYEFDDEEPVVSEPEPGRFVGLGGASLEFPIARELPDEPESEVG